MIDAILMIESYRGARHHFTFLPEMTRSVDELLRELTILDKAKEWRGHEAGGARQARRNVACADLRQRRT